jgi:hypothetical protein
MQFLDYFCVIFRPGIVVLVLETLYVKRRADLASIKSVLESVT